MMWASGDDVKRRNYNARSRDLMQVNVGSELFSEFSDK